MSQSLTETAIKHNMFTVTEMLEYLTVVTLYIMNSHIYITQIDHGKYTLNI